jgi:glycosidase
MASQAIMLSLAGVPGIYVHSLFGSRNCQVCLETTNRARSINREKFELTTLNAVLENMNDQQGRVFSAYRKMLLVRRQEPAFHPSGSQKVLFIDPVVFSLLRVSLDKNRAVICLINVSATDRFCRIDLSSLNLPVDCGWQDLISNNTYQPIGKSLEARLAPYQSCWLAPTQGR